MHIIDLTSTCSHTLQLSSFVPNPTEWIAFQHVLSLIPLRESPIAQSTLQCKSLNADWIKTRSIGLNWSPMTSSHIQCNQGSGYNQHHLNRSLQLLLSLLLLLCITLNFHFPSRFLYIFANGRLGKMCVWANNPTR